MLALPVYRARNSFSSYRQKHKVPQDSRNLGIESYHIEFGNPFPGKEQGVAHHCVELIYLFESFHDALEKADNGITLPYCVPEGAETLGTEKLSSHNSNSGVGDSIDVEGASPQFSIRTAYGRTNIQLCHDLQDRWIQFIVNDDNGDERQRATNVDEIVVYGKDRVARVESLTNNPKWIEKSTRFEILGKYAASMVGVRKALLGQVLN